MNIAIHQPNYFPWLGYFSKIAQADIFIFLDDVQLPQGRSYVHRTMVRGNASGIWMSAPIRREERQAIRDVRFVNENWRHRHRMMLLHTYRRAPFFDPVMTMLDGIFAFDTDSLSRFNMNAVTSVADYLGLDCRFEVSSTFGVTAVGDDRLIALAQAAGGKTYISGSGGNNYQHLEKFEAAEIDLQVRPYNPRPYRQIQDGFVPGLSVLDALFNLGPDARRLLSYEPAATPYPSL